VAFASQGKTLVATGNVWQGENWDDGVRLVVIWDAATGQELHQWKGKARSEYSCFSPDGSILVEEDLDQLRLWSVATGNEMRRFQAAGGQQLACSGFSADGKVLVAASDDRLFVWEVATGKALRQIPVRIALSSSYAVSPDGKMLAAEGEDGVLRQWDVGTGQERDAAAGHRGPVLALAYAPDGKTMATAGQDRTVRQWDVTTRREIRRYTVEPPGPKKEDSLTLAGLAYSPLAGLAYSPDGKTLAAGWSDGRIILWELAAGDLPRALPGHPGGVTMITFCPDGQTLVSGGGDGLIRVWSPATGKELTHFRAYGEASGSFIPALSADGRILAATSWAVEEGADRPQPVVRLWELASGREHRPIFCSPGDFGWNPEAARASAEMRPEGKPLGLPAVCFAPSGQHLAVACYDSIWLLDLARGCDVRSFRAGGLVSASVTLSPDGKVLAAGSSDGRFYLWDVATGTVRCQVEAHRGAVTALTFAPDGRTLASAAMDSTELTWDVAAMLREETPRPVALADRHLEVLWGELATGDARQAARAIDTLAQDPRRAVPFLSQRLRPEAPVDPRRLMQLIADLDSGRFAVRQRAVANLEGLAYQAETALRQQLAARPPLEVRIRVERLLARLDAPLKVPDQVRALRVVEALKIMNTPESQQLLEALARGAPDAPLTQAALRRPSLPPDRHQGRAAKPALDGSLQLPISRAR
jgi:WD40 repeat protein